MAKKLPLISEHPVEKTRGVVNREAFLSAIKMRRADMSDCEDLFRWRNDPETIKNSVHIPKPVSIEEHGKWFAAKLKNPATRLYIGMFGKEKVGLMRFEIEDDRVLVGTNVNPVYRGMGVGSKIMNLTTREMFNSFGKPIVAEIRNDNIASIKMCAKNGYVIKNKTEDVTYMYFYGTDSKI